MESLLDFLGPAVRRLHRRRVRVRAGEPGHVLAEEALQRVSQLFRHLGCEHRAADLARGLVGADEGDAGWAEAEVFFQCLGAIRGKRSLDVVTEEVHAFLAMLDGARQTGVPAKWGEVSVIDLPEKMQAAGWGFAISCASVI